MARPVYLDNHATTPVDPRVAEAMWPYFTERFGNAGSRHHEYGWEAGEAVETARSRVARPLGARPRDVIFTSGATEANNLAIKGVLMAERGRGRHIVTLATEHASVLDACRRLAGEGCELTCLPVPPDGVVDLDMVRAAVTDGTVLVSVMAANNEIGVLQPLAGVAAIAHERGAWFHTDAVQALGKVPFDIEASGADLVSLSAHKIYGPKGVGALVVRRRQPRVPLTPLLDGGGQERGLRSGTLNVPAIVGFGMAADLAERERPDEAPRLARLRDRLLEGLRRGVPDLVVNGTMSARLPGNLNVSLPGVDGERLLVGLDDVAASSGAACTAAQPSHVLRALGHPVDLALASLRFGLGRWTTDDDIDRTVASVTRLVGQLRAMAPAS